MDCKHRLSNGLEFFPRPLKKPYIIDNSLARKNIPQDLSNVTANPLEHKAVQPGRRKIHLGAGAENPEDLKRYPLYISSDILSSHLLIAGAIGSGKTSLLLRLLAGAVKNYGSVVISEAKGGKDGKAEGAAFTDIAQYLQQKYPELNVYRWPRGNCWFNPLNYLKTVQDRRAFFDSVCHELQSNGSIAGDMVAYVNNACNIAELIITYLKDYAIADNYQNVCTLRNLVKYLRNHSLLRKEIKSHCHEDDPDSEALQELGMRLEMLNFFYVQKPEFAMTRHGINILADFFEHDDLLNFSQPQDNLPELQLDDILYHWSLVIVSQPLNKPESVVVGSLFWDSLLARVIELGPNPEAKSGIQRQKVLAVLDETHRLPVGRLGSSGDFLREYNLGLVEITPTIVDEERWQQNQHVYQTIISLSPGVPQVVELMQSRLPNFFLRPGYLNTTISDRGVAQTNLEMIDNYQYYLAQDNSGVSARSLRMTGRFTGLIQSVALDEQGKVFWLDLADDLMANIKLLLKTALSADCPVDIRDAVDRTLGLIDENI
ncbi:MAG: hypothetical protein AAFR62_18850 [Cyanobacteria bacterium J06629_2]